MTDLNITNICNFVEDLEKRLKRIEALFEAMSVCFRSTHVACNVKHPRQMTDLFEEISQCFRDTNVSRSTLYKLCEGLSNQSRYR